MPRLRRIDWAILVGAGAVCACTSPAFAVSPGQGGDPVGVVLEAAGEFGGDDVLRVFYRDGSSQNIRAGQGLTLGVGLHYRPASSPFDFAATVGYKFIGTSDYHSDVGMGRIVLKLTGTYDLPNRFWLTAGPVWHTNVKIDGDRYVPDVHFDDAVGVMGGVGWRWIGVSYTHIQYKSSILGNVDGSNVGMTFAWKF